MVEKILNNTTPYGKIRASHEGSLHSSTLIHSLFAYAVAISINLERLQDRIATNCIHFLFLCELFQKHQNQ